MRLKSFSLPIGAQVFKALSEETRIRIMYLLFHAGELSISDLEQILDFTQTKTSRHLSYLKQSGLVSSRQYRQWTFYFINDEVRDIVQQLLQLMSIDHNLQKDLENYKVMHSNRVLSINKYEQEKKL